MASTVVETGLCLTKILNWLRHVTGALREIRTSIGHLTARVDALEQRVREINGEPQVV